MIFQKPSKQNMEVEEIYIEEAVQETEDNIDTVVGPSVNVEGDFSSEGNIIVKGTVTGSVHTSRVLSVEPGAVVFGKITMPGIEGVEVKSGRRSRKTEEVTGSQNEEYLG